MLKQTVIFGAILLGLAVPSSAQERRIGHGNLATHVLRGEGSTTLPSRSVRTPRRATAPVARRHDRTRGVTLPPRSTSRVPVRHGPVQRRVWVPASIRRVYVPATYQRRWDRACGRWIRVCVRAAYYREVCEPGHWEWRRVQGHRHHHHH